MCSIMGVKGHSLPLDKFREFFERTKSRGPDMTRVEKLKGGIIGFHRLAIMGLHPEGMQPFTLGTKKVVCNGEIYGFRPLKEMLIKKGYVFTSDSDSELLLPLYKEYGTEMFKILDAEYALLIYDEQTKDFIAARDPIGIRPLFFGYQKDGEIAFASEAKNLVGLVEEVLPFPPGYYYKDGVFTEYADVTAVKEYIKGDLDEICRNIREKLIKGIEKRLDSDAPVGFLLSGGLDSSLVCAVAAKLSDKPLRTFSIGMDKDAIDLKYARKVADYIGSQHTEVIISEKDVLEALPTVVELLGTWDITTIRASIGMHRSARSTSYMCSSLIRFSASHWNSAGEGAKSVYL